MNQITYAVLPTSLGWVGTVASPRGIRRLNLPLKSPEQAVQDLGAEVARAVLDPSLFEGLRLRLERYLSGEPVDFNDALDLGDGAPFFHRAWQACAAIPRGETRTYTWLATQAGNSRAVRAAGQAMARNPVSIIIPCHRVIASDGTLCGYGGGLDLKQRLLDLERTSLHRN